MGKMLISCLGLSLTLLAPEGPVCAQTLPDPNPARLFATCTGRLSALMEFQWLIGDPASEATEHLRDQMADLLAAAEVPGSEVASMDLRLQAKVAEAELLAAAHFTRKTPWAAARAESQIARCTALLLSQ